MRNILVLIFAFCFAVGAAPLFAQESQVVGTVKDNRTERAIVGAKLTLISRSGETLASAETNARGQFQLTSGSLTKASLEVRADGYRPAIDTTLDLGARPVTSLSITLAPKLNVDEIVVTTRARNSIQRGSLGSTILTREEIRRAPGTAGDIFRGLSYLPGVFSTGAFSNFTVRGQGPRDNLILIDGIPYDRAVHFDQSLGQVEDIGGGGRFSIFGQEVVGEATFKPGGWEAAYAGAGGALLDLSIAEGNNVAPSYRAKIDLAGGEYLYDGPSGLSKDTSMLISARYYDFGQLFDLISENEIGKPVLQDFLIKTTTQFDSGARLNLIALYTPEKYTRGLENVLASEEFEDPLLLKSDQDAGLVGASYQSYVGDDGRWRNTVYYRWATDISEQGEALVDLNNLPDDLTEIPLDEGIISLSEREKEWGWRSDFSSQNRLGDFNAGLRLSEISVDYAQALSREYALLTFDQNDFRLDATQKYILLQPATFNATLNKSAVRLAGYVDQSFMAGDIDLTLGLRLDHDALINATRVSPRFQALWRDGYKTSVNLTAGHFTQSPRVLEIAATPENNSLQPEEITQFSLGVTHALSDIWSLYGEVYYQRLRDLISEEDRVTSARLNSGNGNAVGFDISLSRAFADKWTATAKYGYNRTRVEFGDGLGKRPSQFNRPHVINMTLYREMGDKWSMGLQYQVASGRPADRYDIHPIITPDTGLARYSREITGRFEERYPSYRTLNFRVDYRKRFGGVTVKGFIDIINLTARKNVDDVDFSNVTGLVSRDNLGVFPQIGLSIAY